MERVVDGPIRREIVSNMACPFPVRFGIENLQKGA